jgi:NTE family protein
MKSLTLFRRILRRRRPRIGLALGGGGARGLAHLGVLQVLEEHGIPIDLIIGTSMGAIVGGAYAQEPDAQALEARIVAYLQSREEKEELAAQRVLRAPSGRLSRWANSLLQYYYLSRDARRSSLLEEEPLRRMISALLQEEPIEQTKIPFAAVAVDLLAGEVAVLDRGPIRVAVEASAAIPGVFPPMRLDERLLVDGGVSSLVPVEEAREKGADAVIAVDVGQELEEAPPPERGIDLLFRADEIARARLKRLHLRQADLVIRPQIGHLQWFEFARYREIIAHGEEAGREALPQLARIL